MRRIPLLLALGLVLSLLSAPAAEAVVSHNLLVTPRSGNWENRLRVEIHWVPGDYSWYVDKVSSRLVWLPGCVGAGKRQAWYGLFGEVFTATSYATTPTCQGANGDTNYLSNAPRPIALETHGIYTQIQVRWYDLNPWRQVGPTATIKLPGEP